MSTHRTGSTPTDFACENRAVRTPAARPHHHHLTPRKRPCAEEAEKAAQAFVRSVYDTYGDFLLAYAKGFTAGDEQRAEDIIQEALIRAWRHAATLGATPAMVRPWLFKVVRRLAIDAHRARQARPAESDSSALDHMTVADAVEETVTAQVMARAMENLTEPHREVLVFRFYLDRSVEETAAELDVAEGTVKSRTSHALRSLRQVLIAQGFAPVSAAG
ncbi:sigma-70 family RNA polymerase sigma factor [Streptomyces sp. NPDC020681]|uniref:sigma-70 family RNA polymerase sigma factor n=1 Tax=Streptomyces sp. NPDC020681 TaxID=3365083 RepID=UPI0037969365